MHEYRIYTLNDDNRIADPAEVKTDGRQVKALRREARSLPTS
jgi:hypothetical protein